MIETVTHNGKNYPKFQLQGFAAQFAFPFAQKVCRGTGYDIGCNRLPWMYRDADGKAALPIDPLISSEYDAMKLPDVKVDYIFSSHCLEHLPNWVEALNYWRTKLHPGGVLFLYLPAYSQTYWRPWHNTKNVHIFTPEILSDYLTDKGCENIFVSGVDLNDSFMVMANTPAK